MDTVRGLSRSEVEASRERNGSNRLSEKEKITFWQKYWEKFDDPIITILLVALGINVIFTFLGKVDWFECAGIFISVLLATFVSALSEFKNEETFRNIQSEASKVKCKVYREGRLVEVMIDELVCGDFVLLQSGDLVPADGNVVSGSIKVDQSALNGENKETEKCPSHVPNTYRSRLIDFWDKHSLFRGSVVCSGQCIMEVCEVGDKTVYGRLSCETGDEERKSPLQVKLAALAKSISKFGYIGAALVVLICMFHNIVIDNGWNIAMINRYFSDAAQALSDLISAVILGIIVIVVAVPEGLPLMIAIVCSLNMKKMMKSNVLVRKLIGIETAGSINILFSDKTGTITCGRLKATSFTDGGGRVYRMTEELSEKMRNILAASVVYNSSAYLSDGKILGGNATEKALLELVKGCMPNGLHIKKGREVLFSSERKYSITEVSGDINGAFVKGAPEKILKRCRRFYDSGGSIAALESVHGLSARIDEMAQRCERVIALAVADEFSNSEIPDNLILIGLVGIRDDLRPDVKGSVSEVKRAGIQVVMITGDKKETAVAIAKEAGIVESSRDVVLTSDDLQRMSDDEVSGILPSVRVIARALPTDKSRLVRIAQQKGMVAGMTGDGVNDLAALRRADVGFAMGSGTDVAKEAGDIVILDDNFSSVKKAVLFGRTIYNSIKRFITFQLTINVAAVSVSVLGPIIGVEKPLNITQMLWINLVMDTLAAIAFGGEPALGRYMLERPKRRDEDIIDRRMWSAIITDGLFICIMSMFMFMSKDVHYAFRGHQADIYFYTGYFSFFIFSCIFNAFNARCDGIDLIENISLNKPFLAIIFLICSVQILITYFGGAFIGTAGLTVSEWVTVLVMSVLIIPVDIIRKLIVRGR